MDNEGLEDTEKGLNSNDFQGDEDQEVECGGNSLGYQMEEEDPESANKMYQLLKDNLVFDFTDEQGETLKEK